VKVCFYVIMSSGWIETKVGRVELLSVCLSSGSVSVQTRCIFICVLIYFLRVWM
jgi:hypothetical protein